MVLIGQLVNGEPFDEQLRAFHVTEVKPVQSLKADSSILVTPSGIVTEVKPLNPEHKHAGICSTLSPNVMVLIFALLENGELFNEQFRAFHVTEVKPSQPEKAPSPILVTASGMVTEVKPVQPEKAELPILVTDSGIVTKAKPVQSKKAELPILVTDSGMVIEVKPLNPEHKYSVIFSTLSPNVMVLIGQLINGEPFDEQLRAFHATEVKPLQPSKAS